MNNILKLFLLSLLVLQFFLITTTVRKKKLSMKYASFWIILILLMAIIVIFPDFLFTIAGLLGFEVASNMIFIISFFLLFYIIFMLTTSISIQNYKIKNLIQEISILKEQVDKSGKKD